MADTIVPLGGAGSVKALVYQSTTIFERRRRILHEARAIISEVGYENLSIRELARRAQVAQRTLYNAFGSRENIVINAIQQYLRDFSEHTQYIYPNHALKGRLERLIRTHSRNLQIRPYTVAVMTVYNSLTSDPSIRRAIRALSEDGLQPFVEHLAACRQLAARVTPESLSEHLTTQLYATLSSWCAGEIADGAMVERMAETFLIVTVASTKGATRTDAARWLADLRAGAPEWRQLRAESTSPDSPQRAPRRAARAG